jgi:hypothetical protein
MCKFRVVRMISVFGNCLMIWRHGHSYWHDFAMGLKGSDPVRRKIVINNNIVEYLMFCWPCVLLYRVNRANLVHNFFLICLLNFSTCFGQLCVYHQEKLPYICDTWYLSLYMYDCLVCRAFRPAYQTVICTYRVTNTRCRKGTAISPDNGHIVARNM